MNPLPVRPRRAASSPWPLLLGVALSACATGRPQLLPRLPSEAEPDPLVVCIAVTDLRATDLREESAEGTPLLPALRRLEAESLRWSDVLPAAAGSAGLWALWTAEDPRVALRSGAPSVTQPLREGWHTTVLPIPPSLLSDPEWNADRDRLIVAASEGAVLEELRTRDFPRPGLVLVALDPGATLPAIETSGAMDPGTRERRLADLDAALAPVIDRLRTLEQVHVVLTGIPANPPPRRRIAGLDFGRDTLRVPLLWSTPDRTSRDLPVAAYHGDLRPALRTLADRTARTTPTLFAPADSSRHRAVLWWNDNDGGAWWERGAVGVRLLDDWRQELYDLQADPSARHDRSSLEPGRARAHVEEARATLGLVGVAWQVWMKGSPAIDFLELRLSAPAGFDSVTALALEEIDEVEQLARETVRLAVAAEPESDGAQLWPRGPLASLQLRPDGTLATGPLPGIPVHAGVDARPVGLGQRTLGAFSRPWWTAQTTRLPTAGDWLRDHPVGVHVLWGKAGADEERR